MKKHKPFKDRDHTASKEAKALRRGLRAQTEGKPTNVGDPNNKFQGQGKKAKS